MIKELEKIGFTKNEAHVYSVCLRKGASTAFKLSQSLDLPTSTIYDTLKKLRERGLVKLTPRKGKKYFEPADPEILEKLTQESFETAQKLVPTLNNLYMNNTSNARVYHYETTEAARETFKEFSEQKSGEVLILGSLQVELNIFGKSVQKNIDKRVKNKTRVRIITEDSDAARSFKEKDNLELRTTKVVDVGEPFESIIYMWADTVVIASLGEKISIVRMEDKFIYQIHKQTFESMWQYHPEVT